MPSLNEVPAFWGMLGNNPAYKDAAFKAQQAFFIQTGIQSKYDMVTGYVSTKVTEVAQKAQSEVATVIDEETPLNSKHVFFAVAAGYTIAVKKEYTQRFRNPLFRNVSHTATVGTDHGSLGVSIPF